MAVVKPKQYHKIDVQMHEDYLSGRKITMLPHLKKSVKCRLGVSKAQMENAGVGTGVDDVLRQDPGVQPPRPSAWWQKKRAEFPPFSSISCGGVSSGPTNIPDVGKIWILGA